MIDETRKGSQRKTLSINDYAEKLTRAGKLVFPSGLEGTFWVGYEPGSLTRIPTFNLEPPDPGEVQQTLWRGRAAVLSYLLEPDAHHPANAWFYVCSNREYSLDHLSSAMRRNVRRGLRELRIEPINLDQLLEYGAQAFCDTRRRIGLSDGTCRNFRRRYTSWGKCSEHVFLGAWKGDILAAFLSIAEVADWAEFEGSFSCDSLLHLRPNDTLRFYALSYYLLEREFRIVSSGISSIQSTDNQSGLHNFMMKCGFEARSVHRAFVLHPLLLPIPNRLVHSAIKTMVRFKPKNRLLRKANGVLTSILEKNNWVETERVKTVQRKIKAVQEGRVHCDLEKMKIRSTAELKFELFTYADLASVVKLHMMCFTAQENFAMRLGSKFLFATYEFFLQDSKAFGFVAKRNEELCAVLVGRLDYFTRDLNSYRMNQGLQAIVLQPAVIIDQQLLKITFKGFFSKIFQAMADRKLKFAPSHDAGKTATLASLCVHPDYRTLNLSSKLLSRAEDLCREKGMRKLRSGIRRNNLPSRFLFGSRGYIVDTVMSSDDDLLYFLPL